VDPVLQASALVTANEIHIPIGRRVRLKLFSHDVIHSFWVPALQGKVDLVPGVADSVSSWIVAAPRVTRSAARSRSSARWVLT
jgi:heme/copper-type cytochrome/quinol oxidase subunit 2